MLNCIQLKNTEDNRRVLQKVSLGQSDVAVPHQEAMPITQASDCVRFVLGMRPFVVSVFCMFFRFVHGKNVQKTL